MKEDKKADVTCPTCKKMVQAKMTKNVHIGAVQYLCPECNKGWQVATGKVF